MIPAQYPPLSSATNPQSTTLHVPQQNCHLSIEADPGQVHNMTEFWF
ncbi:hypothetical protein X978_5485 [Burkholderia pseudomallei MSHR3965]|nr:hypothetical protein BBK_4478 [Burkholderia pseudomallei NCTC 13179]AIV81817.1 hypothetical protein X978_5485 [Burkholderia pseudomallei MSHR3965]KGD07103.1 hypothetical protein DO63_4079 [Burkholderia pseudomallei]KGS35090.1 hypothetical protein X992_1665 [Burkholderia pseudomallei MSHR5492]KGU75928.1 hypothetical protein X883_3847 [Burkholderia pseudomallei MSHR4304]KGV38939.1 hypothetical protein X884_131 [Burkholderia pseudomallei MSHR4308]KGW06993.1 hypothetical protein X980_4368 [Bur